MDMYLLGVTESSKLTRVALVRKSGTTLSLSRLARLPIISRENQTLESVVGDWAQKVIPVGTKVRVVFSLLDGTLFVKEMEVPSGSNAEIAQAIKWELVTKHATFPKDALLQWQKHSGSNAVTALAMREMDAGRLSELSAKGGWSLLGIEPVLASLSRVMDLPSDPWLLVAIEGNQISITIAQGQTTRFVSIGDLRQADQSVINNHINVDSIESALTHIRAAIRHWATKSTIPLKNVIVVGDAATSQNLVKKIHSALGLEVKLPTIKATTNLRFGKAKADAVVGYAHTIGTALRAGSFSHLSNINFMTKSMKLSLDRAISADQWTKAAHQFTQLNAFFALVMTGLLAIIVYMTQTVSYETNQNKQFITNHPGQSQRAEVAKTNALLATVDTLIAKQQDMGIRLGFFSTYTPQNLTFTSLKLTNSAKQEWTVEGTGNRSAILAFYTQLKSQAKEADVHMVYSSLEKENNANFRIIVIW